MSSHLRSRVILAIGAVILGVGASRLLRGTINATDPGIGRVPSISMNASYLFVTSGKVVRLATLPVVRAGRDVLIGIFSESCVACTGQIDAFIDVARSSTESTIGIVVVLVTDSVGPIEDDVAARKFGRNWNAKDVDYFRADRSMARSWGMREYPALIRLTRSPESHQEFLGAGPRFAAALAELGRRAATR